jgi:hypothetical protein
MEDGLQVDAIYTDFSKAFDRVNHGLLLSMLTRKFRGPIILLDIFENVRVVAYADDLKLNMCV